MSHQSPRENQATATKVRGWPHQSPRPTREQPGRRSFCATKVRTIPVEKFGWPPIPSVARHRQVKLEGDGEAPRLARAANLWGGFGASDLDTHRERLRADGSVLGGRKVIAVEVEEVVDLVVRREEPLHLSG